MEVLLQIGSKGFALPRKVPLAKNIFNQAHSKGVDIGLGKVQTFEESGEVTNFGSHIGTHAGVLSLSLNPELESLLEAEGVSQFELPLAFENVAGGYVQMVHPVRLAQPVQS